VRVQESEMVVEGEGLMAGCWKAVVAYRGWPVVNMMQLLQWILMGARDSRSWPQFPSTPLQRVERLSSWSWPSPETASAAIGGFVAPQSARPAAALQPPDRPGEGRSWS